MSKPRIVTVTDQVDAPTGFGRQHAMLCDALAATGKYQLFSLGLWDDGKVKLRNGYISFPTTIPGGDGGGAVADLEKQWPTLMRTFKPDIVIAIGDIWMFPAINSHEHERFDWISWLPIDALPFPARFRTPIRKMSRLVHMSQWGAVVAEPVIGGMVRSSVIPLATNPSVFCPVPPERKATLREFWSDHLQFDLVKAKHVLLCHDTNQWRKNTPALLEMMTLLPNDTVLVLHCHEIPQPGSGGWDLADLAKESYGVYDRVCITGKGTARLQLSDAEMATLVQACDIRVSATTGEGFGVCSIEAAACGVPTVITDYTTGREILDGDPPCGLFARVAAFGTQSDSPYLRAHVDPADMAAKVKMLCEDADLYRRCSEEGVRRVRERYTTEIIGRQWVELLDRHVASR